MSLARAHLIKNPTDLMRGTNSNCIFLDIRGMKKIICFLTGFLFFACSNNPAVTDAEVEDDWVYGVYDGVGGLFEAEEGFLSVEYVDGWNSTFTAENITKAIVYKKQGTNYFQVAGRNIPPLEFKDNIIEYQDSVVTLYVEKYKDRFYVEFTAPRFYEDINNRYNKRDNRYLKIYKSKTFLYWVK